MKIRHNVAISALTTFQNEGALPEVWQLETVEDAAALVQSGRSYFILGKGSNTLLNPATTCAIIATISPQWCVPIVTGTCLHVGAGTPVNTLMKLCLEHGLTGLEFAAGVPASVGGMVAMNFGCWGTEMADVVDRILVMDSTAKTRWLTRDELNFGYRSSLIQTHPLLVLEVVVSLQTATQDRIKATQHQFIAERLAKQPLRARTFGSTFKNPEGAYAGAIIESLGYKGVPMGPVMFSPEHANFLVNTGGAHFEDALSAITTIQALANEQCHIQLETEVKFIL